MSEQNKNTGAVSAPATTDKGNTTPDNGKREQNTGTTPNLEQGREHIPNVNAQKEAADSRRKEEQAHVPTATSKAPEKADASAIDRKDTEAGDAKRAVAEGQGSTKPGHDVVKPTGNTNTGGNH